MMVLGRFGLNTEGFPEASTPIPAPNPVASLPVYNPRTPAPSIRGGSAGIVNRWSQGIMAKWGSGITRNSGAPSDVLPGSTGSGDCSVPGVCGQAWECPAPFVRLADGSCGPPTNANMGRSGLSTTVKFCIALGVIGGGAYLLSRRK